MVQFQKKRTDSCNEFLTQFIVVRIALHPGVFEVEVQKTHGRRGNNFVHMPGAEGIDGVALTQQSLVEHLGGWTQYFLTVAILLFAFSSIMYNYYLGENALTFMTENPMAVLVLRLAIMGIVFLGAVAPGATAVFSFSDPMMGILAVVNLLALMMLFPIAMRVIGDFRAQLAAGVAKPVFDPAQFPDLDTDPTAWPDAPGAKAAAAKA